MGLLDLFFGGSGGSKGGSGQNMMTKPRAQQVSIDTNKIPLGGGQVNEFGLPRFKGILGGSIGGGERPGNYGGTTQMAPGAQLTGTGVAQPAVGGGGQFNTTMQTNPNNPRFGGAMPGTASSIPNQPAVTDNGMTVSTPLKDPSMRYGRRAGTVSTASLQQADMNTDPKFMSAMKGAPMPIGDEQNSVGAGLYSRTTSALGTKYKFGAKSSKAGAIDCSGWTAENTLATMKDRNGEKGGTYDLDQMKKIMNTGAAYQISNLEKLGAGISPQELSTDKPEEGVLIGLTSKTNVPKWASDRPYGISHIAQVTYKDGQPYVSESRSKDGVALTPYKEWMNSHQGYDMRAANPFKVGTPRANSSGYKAPKGAINDTLPAEYYTRVAQIESSGNPNVNKKGLYQITDRTWGYLQKKYGKELNISGDMRKDPDAALAMTQKYGMENANALQNKLGRRPEPYEVYMAHNIGPGGANRLLHAKPGEIVTRELIGSSPLSNPRFLTNNKRPITVAEAIQRYQKAFEGVSNSQPGNPDMAQVYGAGMNELGY